MLAAAVAISLAATDARENPGVGPGAPLALSRASRTLVLAPAQMFRLAEIAEGKSDLTLAFSIYEALEDNPDPDIRAEARFRHAKRLLVKSEIAMRRCFFAAWSTRSRGRPRPGSNSRMRCSCSASRTRRLRKLRAVQAIGLPPAVARLVDRYSEALRAARPEGASLEIAIAPDSNINRATRSDTLGTVLGDFEIDEDGKAKSGTGLSVHGQAYRRLGLGDGDTSLLVRLSGFADLYRRTDFNDIAVDLAVGPELRWGESRIHVEAGATQRFFGQKPFLRSARVGRYGRAAARPPDLAPAERVGGPARQPAQRSAGRQELFGAAGCRARSVGDDGCRAQPFRRPPALEGPGLFDDRLARGACRPGATSAG